MENENIGFEDASKDLRDSSSETLNAVFDALHAEWDEWAKQWPPEYRTRFEEFNNMAGRAVADEIALSEGPNLTEKARDEIYRHRCEVVAGLPPGYLEDYKKRYKESIENWVQMIRTGADAGEASGVGSIRRQ